MFCPRCSAQASDEVKFCKNCGANLQSIREATTGSNQDKFDWSQTWLADMVLTPEELDRRRGVTPEMKRIREIKAGVITTLVGVGVMIFLYFFLGAVASSEHDKDAEILRKVWLAGVVPFLIGLGILFNGLVLGKREVQLHKERERRVQGPPPLPDGLPAKTTSQLAIPDGSSTPDFSVTEKTTAHLAGKRTPFQGE
jgi:zinc-ribbon domain